MQDLESGLYYTLWIEVSSHSVLNEDALKALKNYIRILAKVIIVITLSYYHVIMLSRYLCYHVIMLSRYHCYHVIMLSRYHVITLSCYHVIMLSFLLLN